VLEMSVVTANPLAPAVGRVARWCLLVELAILAVSGSWLYFYYRPIGGHRTASEFVTRVHQALAYMSLATVLVMLFALAFSARPSQSLSKHIPGGVAVVAAGGAVVSGWRLPWDHLSLWAVTVGSDMRGFRVALGSQVRFVGVGGHFYDRGSIAAWLIGHVLLAIAVFAGAAALRRNLD
jgi:quinol-cytochrome oxidoreductase complex cytochrome b subunit